VAQHHPLPGGQAAQAFITGRRRQPGTDPVGVLDPVDVLEQPQPGGLHHVGGIALDQFEFHRDRPDQPGKLVNQAFPGLVIALSGAPHQGGHIRSPFVLLKRRRQLISPLSMTARRNSRTGSCEFWNSRLCGMPASGR
jgi:hypothetical protein